MVGSLQFQARATAVVRLHVVALAVVVLAALVSSAAAAARTEEALTTYFLDVTTPEVTVSADQPWECATRVQLRLTEDSVPARMPVVTVSTQTGMVHTVVNTVEWLKRNAAAHARVKQFVDRNPTTEYRYPVSGLVLNSASAMISPEAADPDVLTTFARETASWRPWKHLAAPSALLQWPGKGVAAVADFVDVSLENDNKTAVLTLDIVHRILNNFSEFVIHSAQYTGDDRAHYHFFVPAGTVIDAARFQDMLKEAAFKPPALSIFFKGLPDMRWHKGVDNGVRATAES